MTTPAQRPESPHRTERRLRAMDTRAAVLAAATRLFVQLGYANVSLCDIAREVGVTPPLVRSVTGGKAEILMLLIEEGSHDPIVEWTVEAVRGCDEPREAIAKAVHGIRVDNERYADLVPVMGSTADDDGPGQNPDRSDQYYRDRMGEIIGRLGVLGALKPGLDRERAVGILWFYLGHHSWRLCVSEQGWSWAQTEAWLTEQITAALLAPGPPPVPA